VLLFCGKLWLLQFLLPSCNFGFGLLDVDAGLSELPSSRFLDLFDFDYFLIICLAFILILHISVRILRLLRFLSFGRSQRINLGGDVDNIDVNSEVIR